MNFISKAKSLISSRTAIFFLSIVFLLLQISLYSAFASDAQAIENMATEPLATKALATTNGLVESVTSETLSQAQVKQLIDDTFAVMQQHYIDPDVIPDTKQLILARFHKGNYSSITTVKQFAAVIGTEIRNVTDDDHLSLYRVEPNEEVTYIQQHQAGKLTYNYAFEQVSYLEGNIGYLKFNKFHPDDRAKDTVDAAFNFLKNSDGMIINLQDTIGGSPELVRYILSYFMPKNTPLWEVLGREGKRVENVIVSDEPKHSRFLQDYPIWIVTSYGTASASEIFTAAMQANGKAKVIGDTTTGAGFYVGVKKITDELIMRISVFKPIISINQQSWEKFGITPDLKVPHMDALNHAKRIAYAELQAGK